VPAGCILAGAAGGERKKMSISNIFLDALKDSNVSSKYKGNDVEINFQHNGKSYNGLIKDPGIYSHIYIDIPTKILGITMVEYNLRLIMRALNYRKTVIRWQFDRNNNLISSIHIRTGRRNTIIARVKKTIIDANRQIKIIEPIIDDMITGKIDRNVAADRLGVRQILFERILK